jgi:hypothetical protein
MRRILVTNDDGVHSEGIRALAEVLADLGEVTVVAPVGESSAIGHALTLGRPLRLETVSERVYSVDGTPTDCVNIAFAKVLRSAPVGAWLSLVEHSVRDRGVGGSNPLAPTTERPQAAAGRAVPRWRSRQAQVSQSPGPAVGSERPPPSR